jgi:hypothetical protein
MVGGVTLPIAAIGASIGLLFAGIVQMAEGRFRLLGLHIPPGVALFGPSILLSIYACLCRPTQSTTLEGQPIIRRAQVCRSYRSRCSMPRSRRPEFTRRTADDHRRCSR